MPLQQQVFHPAQTLRQAKKAFRKSSAKPKLSASELAVIERRAVLQERADRIRERELRRKANIKKREEKKEREKDSLIRQGRELPKEGGIKIGPSQLELTKFLPVVKDYISKEPPIERQTVENIRSAKEKKSQAPASSASKPDIKATLMAPPPRPLQRVLPASTSTEHSTTVTTPYEERHDEDFDGLFVSNTQVERELCSSPDTQIGAKPSSSVNACSRAAEEICEDSAMISAQLPTHKLQCCDDLTHHPSNQEDELSPIAPLEAGAQSTALQQEHMGALEDWNSEESTLLADICTQDLLDFANVVELKPQEAPCLSRSFSSMDYSDGFDDHDLECIAVQFESQS